MISHIQSLVFPVHAKITSPTNANDAPEEPHCYIVCSVKCIWAVSCITFIKTSLEQ